MPLTYKASQDFIVILGKPFHLLDGLLSQLPPGQGKALGEMTALVFPIYNAVHV